MSTAEVALRFFIGFSGGMVLLAFWAMALNTHPLDDDPLAKLEEDYSL